MRPFVSTVITGNLRIRAVRAGHAGNICERRIRQSAGEVAADRVSLPYGLPRYDA
jgi:hypothetical protein